MTETRDLNTNSVQIRLGADTPIAEDHVRYCFHTSQYNMSLPSELVNSAPLHDTFVDVQLILETYLEPANIWAKTAVEER